MGEVEPVTASRRAASALIALTGFGDSTPSILLFLCVDMVEDAEMAVYGG